MSDEARNPMDDVELVEVYAASSALGAERITMLLQDEGISAQRRDSSVSGFPSVGTEAQLIVVPSTDKEKARALIQRAIDDDVLPGEGSFV